MSLKLAGEEMGLQEKIKTVHFGESGKDSGDLESGTKTITATSKQGTPDYTTDLTIPAPTDPDGLFTLLLMAMRLVLTVDSMTANTLNWSVELNDVEKITGSCNAVGDYADCEDFTSGWNALGTAQNIKIYFWVDSGNAVLSKVQTQLAPGSAGTDWENIAKIKFAGFMSLVYYPSRFGTGTYMLYLRTEDQDNFNLTGGSGDQSLFGWISSKGVYLRGHGSVATDLNFLQNLLVNCWSLE